MRALPLAPAFPTRRSSDLEGDGHPRPLFYTDDINPRQNGQQERDYKDPFPAAVGFRPEKADGHGKASREGGDRHHPGYPGHPSNLKTDKVSDRKSTRLNSSHVAIS